MTSLRSLLPENISLPKDCAISKICLRAQDVQDHDLCFVFPSYQGRDLTEFIAMAESRGAKAIVVPSSSNYQSSKSIIISAENPRAVLSYTASQFYPLQPKHVVAVTGTNGKSSVVNFVNQIWAHQNILGASLGTLGLNINSSSEYLNPDLTTPHALELHRIMHELAQADIHHLALEASSQGLDQNRMDHVNIEAAAFTNFTQDHLDYHKTFLNYFEAKALLFRQILPQNGTAVLNADIEKFELLKEICNQRGLKTIIDYGKKARWLQILSIQPWEDHQECVLRIFDKTYNIKIPLIGEFQVYNALAAMGLCLGSGLRAEDVLASLEVLTSIPGRLEFVGINKNEARIYVDYSHTPDALINVLHMIKASCSGKIHLVFGCGGNRDKEKRLIMGRIAEKSADVVYVTDDNPRNENPTEIRQQIRTGAPKAIDIGDRYEAIETAIQNAKQGDVVLIAGKGHETVQIYGDLKYDFNDRQVAQEVIEKGF